MRASGIAKSCPICGKPTIDKFRPFCSARCANVDLNRWLNGSYVIPVNSDRGDNDSDPAGLLPVDPEDDDI